LVSRIQRHEPDPRWFVRRPEGIHGLAHETRVLVWTQVLADMVRNEGLVVDPIVLGWAAAIHDTQRWSDGDDLDHGARAASWLLEHSGLLPASVPLHRVTYLCRWHVPPDHLAPEMTPELCVFKDADALDRWRIGDLDPSRLRTESSRLLLSASHALWMATRDLSKPDQMFLAVQRAAMKLGILREQ
jgi:uncharacterized protein